MNRHPVLIAVCERVPPQYQPQKPFHLGGPDPFVPEDQLVALGRDCLRFAIKRGAPLAVESLEQIDRLLERIRTEGAMAKSPTLHPYGVGLTGAVQHLLHAAYWSVVPNEDKPTSAASLNVSACCSQLAHFLVTADSPDVTAYVEHVDASVNRHELLARLAYEVPDVQAEIETVLWRKAHQTYLTTHWIARLRSERLAILANTDHSGWTWFSGDDNDVLAMVPDELFEDAAVAVFG